MQAIGHSRESSPRRMRLFVLCLAAVWWCIGAGMAAAQPRQSPPAAPSAASAQQFVAANLLFVLLHELGHAAISEFRLPVLGREEDAADTFATLSLLHVGSDRSHRILTDTARGLMLIALRDKLEGRPPVFYSEHGLDVQRAYQIVCLMYGSDLRRFTALADIARLPPERRDSCRVDFDLASSSWVGLLEKHARPGSGKPSFVERLLRRKTPDGKPRVDIVYDTAGPGLDGARKHLQASAILERMREFVQDNLDFPRPITLRAKTCGEPGAYWDPQDRTISLCYEMVPEMLKIATRPAP